MLEELDLFHGDTTDNLSHVYARLMNVDEIEGLTLAGHVRGPFCQFSQTLPTTAPLVDLGPGKSLLARAAVTDPCFWSPDLPSLYDVHVELLRDGEVVEMTDRSFGIRSLGARSVAGVKRGVLPASQDGAADSARPRPLKCTASLFLNGRRWVPRGVHRRAASQADLTDCRETATTLVIEDPDDEICAAASRHGVFIVALVNANGHQRDELRRLARWAAVGVAVIQTDVDFDPSSLAPNLVLAQSITPQQPVVASAWADLVVGSVESPALFRDQFAGCELPVVASRRIAENLSIVAARAECDRLQRELAPVGDFAGYLV